ncbi:hypothetical protein ES319_D08G040700v1 [Gossypium barbadense]|uniref:RING-type domain-containing protein n=9 Tax=Gossypium TaxID=3633 RepID=A0A5J5Q9D6_GOSBA|nr:hypothetical protein ES319_D08G040700v1 [Gossypium barbadense]
MFGSGMNLITTVIGFGMSATFIVFVCTKMICRRIRGSQTRLLFQTESRIDLEQAEAEIRGVEPVVVAAIPTIKFNREAFKSMEDAQCSICLGEYEEKEVLRIMPKCAHNFHLSCIDVWLRKHSTCPVCRTPLLDSLEFDTGQSGTHLRRESMSNRRTTKTGPMSGRGVSTRRDDVVTRRMGRCIITTCSLVLAYLNGSLYSYLVRVS